MKPLTTITAKPFTTVAAILLALIAVLHVVRLVFGWEVTVNTIGIPNWASVVGVIVAGGLAWMLWVEARK
ncbi:MAG: hypothetical protein L0Z68_02120 [Gammaproteobacteria bacterium]|nr:hypothetical protein [Gammaproteobacteria bacterium]